MVPPEELSVIVMYRTLKSKYSYIPRGLKTIPGTFLQLLFFFAIRKIYKFYNEGKRRIIKKGGMYMFEKFRKFLELMAKGAIYAGRMDAIGYAYPLDV